MKKQLLLILLLILLLVVILGNSCKTREQRSYRLFEKAQRLNPNLVTTIDTTITIDTLLVYKDTLLINADTTKFLFEIEELKKEGLKVLFENEKLKVEVRTIKKTGKDGKVSYRREGIVTNKAKEIIRQLRFRYYITKTFPAKVITIKEKEPHGTIWWVGLISLVASASLVIYKILKTWKLR
jgi:hypothetical protein